MARAFQIPSADSFMALFRDWKTIVGSAASQHSRPVELVDGRLVVRVDHPAWATALRAEQATILARLAEKAGPGVVTEMSVFTGHPGRRGPR